MLNLKNIVLGSKSPRRQELLKYIISDFEVISKDVEEIVPNNIQPRESAKYLAQLKSSAYTDEISNKTIITSDTIVLLNNLVLGKPKDKQEAFDMLKSLSGKSHDVITGVCIKNKNKELLFDETTKVYFNPLTEEEINYYIDTYQPFDKAGAYGIQEWIGMIGVEKIEGCFYNVMGLPLQKIYGYLHLGQMPEMVK